MKNETFLGEKRRRKLLSQFLRCYFRVIMARSGELLAEQCLGLRAGKGPPDGTRFCEGEEERYVVSPRGETNPSFPTSSCPSTMFSLPLISFS